MFSPSQGGGKAGYSLGGDASFFIPLDDPLKEDDLQTVDKDGVTMMFSPTIFRSFIGTTETDSNHSAATKEVRFMS